MGIVSRGRSDEPTMATPQRAPQLRRRRSISRKLAHQPILDVGIWRGVHALLKALPPALPFLLLGLLVWLATLGIGLVIIFGSSTSSLASFLLPNGAPAVTYGVSLITFAHMVRMWDLYFMASFP